MPAGQSLDAGIAGRGSFMVRVWREAGNGWRGRVTHVQSGATGYFQTTARLWTFVRECLGLNPLEPFLDEEHVTLTHVSSSGPRCEDPLSEPASMPVQREHDAG